jgi:4-alpha-glucanotransferase
VTPDDLLERLARAHGVATSYEDQLHRPVAVGRDAVVAVLGLLGVDASTPEGIRASLADLDHRSPVPPVVVVRRSRGGPVTVGGPALLRLEDGTHRTVASDGGQLVLPPGLPLGWHQLETGDRLLPVVVTPDHVLPMTGRNWGWMVQLYALRSSASWGIGDIGDLSALADWTARQGGGLVLVNPLHAVAPTPPMQPSPYYPGSRRWTNPVYLRPEHTHEYAAAPADVRSAVDALRVGPGIDNTSDRIDRDASWAAKRAALELLRPFGEVREADDDLMTFATWCALCEVHGNDWRLWPAELRRPDAPAVARARDELADRVGFHAWLQQLCNKQLADAQRTAIAGGMDVGIVHDLAVGADPGGADAWALQDALALGARLGAPPDSFNQQGQDWGMPPWHPRKLADLGYAPLRDMVRSLLRHAGGVRIDHVLGMFRLWWIPDGATARDGTYVSYDAEALLGVIALEAARERAVVVGEDLGTVPERARVALADRGVLGSSVLWFEREDAAPGVTGPLRPIGQWREAAMASVTTHDLPTALAWLRGDHVRLRDELGLLDDPEAEERRWRAERDELLAHLVAAGCLDRVDAPEDDLVRALHTYVAATPSRYVVAAPGDAVGDLRQPNQPGTLDQYPNWRLPVSDSSGRPLLLEDILADPRVARLAADLGDAVR